MAWRESELKRYITLASLAADVKGDWIYCRGARLLIIQAQWTADAGTAGTLALEGTLDPAVGRDNAAAIGDGIEIPTTTGIYGAWPTIGATADKAAVVVEDPFTWMRLVVTAAGGVADQLRAFYDLRS